jgi:hypothetical protein
MKVVTFAKCHNAVLLMCGGFPFATLHPEPPERLAQTFSAKSSWMNLQSQ